MLKRILVILQLCISFSMLLYFLGYPFFGSHFFYQSEQLLIESAMGEQALLSKIAPEKALQAKEIASYKTRGFSQLLPDEKSLVLRRKKAVNDYFSLSPLEKIAQGFKLFTFIPLALLCWMLLAIVLSVLLLLKNKRAPQLLFLLPLFAGIYGVTNFLSGNYPAEMELFPSEIELAQLAPGEEVKAAWDKYLIEHWGKPNENAQEQLALAEQKFQVLWLEKKAGDPSSSFTERVHPYLLLFFFLWNLFFALQIRKGLSR